MGTGAARIRGYMHGVRYRLPQRLAGRTRQQLRADAPGAVRADGADRLVAVTSSPATMMAPGLICPGLRASSRKVQT